MNAITETPALTPGTPHAGGIFCWRLFDAQGPYELVVAPRASEIAKIHWSAAQKKAAALVITGHRDWSLPTRAEALAMFEHLRDALADTDDAFERDWYWTSQPGASTASYAWGQSFGHGIQSSYRRSNQLRARAVRRIRI